MLFVAFVAAVAVALLLIPGITQPARAADACHRYGDGEPTELGRKQARQAVTCLINKKRRENGRGGLDHDSRLTEAARKHSQTMARKSCFSHECSSERGVLGRLQAVNYLVGGLTRWAYGENIAWGTSRLGTPKQIVDGWMHSTYHRANILSSTFDDVGVGFANKGDKGFYTADFGLRQG